MAANSWKSSCISLYHPERFKSDLGWPLCSRKVTNHRSLCSSPIHRPDNDSNVKQLNLGGIGSWGWMFPPALFDATSQPQGPAVPRHRADAFHPSLGALQTSTAVIHPFHEGLPKSGCRLTHRALSSPSFTPPKACFRPRPRAAPMDPGLATTTSW